MTKTVFIDCGHGGTDGGAGTRPYLEKELVLTVGNRLNQYLTTNFDVKVVMSRTTDKTLSLDQRTDHANSIDADFLISVHFNASVLPVARGYEDFCYINVTDGSTSEKIRTAIHNEVINRVLKKYSIPNRGRKKANFHMVRESNMPAVLVETLFVSNESDQSLIRNNTYMNDVVIAYGEGIAKGMGLPRKQRTTTAPAPTTGKLYRVQCGAYSVRANADALLTRLKRAGYSAFIVRSGSLYRVQCGAFGTLANAQALERRLRSDGFPVIVYQA